MKTLLRITVALSGLWVFSAHADVTLVYELDGPEMEARTKTIAISRFFARIDDSKETDSFLLFQAGKFFPLFQVNKSAGTYTQLTPKVKPTLHASGTRKPEASKDKPEAKPEEAAPTEGQTEAKQAVKEAASDGAVETTEDKKTDEKAVVAAESDDADAEKKTPKTTLRLTKKNQKIAGVPCRMVEELIDDKPVMTHCMAPKARLGITERETRTLARVFAMARKRDYGWLGTATNDEEFVSVASQDLQSKKTLRLKSVSTDPLPVGHLRVPREFKEVPRK